MKKRTLLALVCVLVLCGCTPGDSSRAPSCTSAETEEPAVQATASPTASASDFEMPERPDPVRHSLHEPMVIDYTYEVDDPRQAAYYHDNVFAAVVTEIGEVYDPHWEPDYVKQHGAPPDYDPCYTKYQLQVTQVLKGDLQEGDMITARRWGYYDKALDAYLMSTDGVMPEVGTEYLCLANQSPETGLYGLSTPNTLIPLKEGAVREATIGKYISACKNALSIEEALSSAGTCDYTALYLQVFEDLWNTDPGLNSGIRYISVDLSKAPGGLTSEEIAQIAKTFAVAHQVQPLTLTHQELQDQGYLADDGMYWEDGLLFSIDCSDFSGKPLEAAHFTAGKWRSGLGAYFFADCTAVWSDSGAFLDYLVGAEAIS